MMFIEDEKISLVQYTHNDDKDMYECWLDVGTQKGYNFIFDIPYDDFCTADIDRYPFWVTIIDKQAKDRAMIASKYGFTDIRYALFHRERIFTAKEYIELLGTYSDHIAIEERIRTKFFEAIEKAINHHGGTITIYDTMDLQLARK